MKPFLGILERFSTNVKTLFKPQAWNILEADFLFSEGATQHEFVFSLVLEAFQTQLNPF